MALPTNYIDGNTVLGANPIIRTYTAGATALTAGMFVTVNSQGTIDVCATGGLAMGYVAEAYAIAATGINVYALQPGMRLKVVAGGAIAVGDLVKLTTGGKVVVEAAATTRTVNTVGQCELASTNDGDLTYVTIR